MQILNILLQITIYSGVLFAAIMVLKKTLGKKMSPMLHYLVWILLVARLLMPVTIDSGLNFIRIPPANIQAQQAGQAQAADNTPFVTPLPNGATQPDINAAVPATEQTAALAPQSGPQPATQPRQAFGWSEVLVAVWLSGVCACLVFMLASYLMLQWRIAQNGQSATRRLKEFLEECKREMGIRTNLRILSCYGLATPALLMPRTVLMPMENLVSMDEEQIKFALRHELMHFRRRDHLVSVLLSVLQAVYWFNPFVWLAFRQMRLDMEVACDNAVVKTMSSREKSGYAQLILSLFTQKTCHRVLGLAQGNTKKVAEKRIRGIYMDEKSRPAVKAVALAVAGILLIGCFTTACQPVVTARPVPADSGTGVFAPSDMPAEAQTPEASPDASLLSPTTGLPGNTEYRPVQVQIDNEVTGRPQYGIQAADIVYEAMIEGEDTRLSAIYNDTLPEKVGPVRSSKVYFQMIQNEWDSIFIHDGGPYVANFPESYIYSDENGGDMKMRIDATRRQDDNIVWHPDVYTAFANVQAAEEKYNYPRTRRDPAFKFNANANYAKYPEITIIDIPFISAQNHVEYRYDKSADKFIRYCDGQPFLDAGTQKAVEVRNVIVQYVTDTPLSGENQSTIPDFKSLIQLGMVGSGKAEFFIGGKYMKGTWEKADRNAGTVYKLEDGSGLVLKPGNTWIELQPDSKSAAVTLTDGPGATGQAASGVMQQEAGQTASPTPPPVVRESPAAAVLAPGGAKATVS